jgi:hypothetical protein
MIEIIRRRRNVWAGEQNVCFGQSIMYIIPSGFPSVLESIIFLVELYFSYFFTRNLTYLTLYELKTSEDSSEFNIRNKLKSLPKSIPDIYNRILGDIKVDNAEAAKNIL